MATVGAPFVLNLECSRTGCRYACDLLQGLSQAGAPLLVRYDLARLKASLDRDQVIERGRDIWMWRELLPLAPDTAPTALGEAVTPLFRIPGFGSGHALIKDEGRLPTGSFKARGMAVAVTMAKQFGKTVLAVPTAGNAGAAAAAYGAAAGMQVHVFMPRDTPQITVEETIYHGARVTMVDGLIDTCGKLVRAAVAEHGWHDLSTLAEPYRLEGKKTMGFELALQLGWTLPDVIYYPTGGGTGFIGMWKAFEELTALGWISTKLPRMVSVQTLGCNPIKTAFDAGHDDVTEPFSPVTTCVHGVRVPKPLGGRLILQVARDSGGHACAVSDEAVARTRVMVARRHGVHLCPEGAACLAAYREDVDNGLTSPDDIAVIFNTASGLKSPFDTR